MKKIKENKCSTPTQSPQRKNERLSTLSPIPLTAQDDDNIDNDNNDNNDDNDNVEVGQRNNVATAEEPSMYLHTHPSQAAKSNLFEEKE